MRHFPIITSTLFFALASTVHAQSSSDQDSTATQQGPAMQTISTTPNAQPDSSASDHTSSNQNIQNAQNRNMPVIITPSNIQWKDSPNFLPPGSQYAVLDGNPKGKGNFTIRVKLPNNYQIKPSYTQNIGRFTVLSGTVNVGVGDNFDTNAGTALPAGSFVVLPAKKHHYLWTSEESVVQVNGTGPWTLKYVNLADDPRKSGAKAGSPTTTPADQLTGGSSGINSGSSTGTSNPQSNTNKSSNY